MVYPRRGLSARCIYTVYLYWGKGGETLGSIIVWLLNDGIVREHCGGTVAKVHHTAQHRRQGKWRCCNDEKFYANKLHALPDELVWDLFQTEENLMKKILFATTALVATAGVAAADITVGGNARFGIGYDSGGAPGFVGTGGYPSNGNDRAINGRSKTSLISRFRLQFDATSETDGGVTIGGRVRAEADNEAWRGKNPNVNPAGFPNVNAAQVMLWSAPRLFATYGGFTLGAGNINGALESTPGFYLATRSGGTGLDGMQYAVNPFNVNNNYFNWDYYDSDGNVSSNGVEAIYNIGGFGTHLSYSKADGPNGRDLLAMNASYKFSNFTVAATFQQSDIAWTDKAGFSVQGDFGDFGARLAYADNDGIDKIVIAGDYKIGAATTLIGWVGREDGVSAADVALGRNDNRDGVAGSNAQEGTSYGIHLAHDLGGGVSFETGYQRNSNSNKQFQAGVAFSF